MKLEEKLVSLRKKKGLSQMKLAEMMNVSRQAISRWERGTAIPSTDNLKYLGHLYNVSLEYLLHDDAPDSEEILATDVTADNGDMVSRKDLRRWGAIILAFLVVAGIIGAVIAQKEPEKRNFSEVESEDWNDVSTDNIPIEW